eukprot:m.35160 g.35160  ORF g.35160 m.35160 type:complete len:523 (-) comp17094_c0_seq1:233-1801(-)
MVGIDFRRTNVVTLVVYSTMLQLPAIGMSAAVPTPTFPFSWEKIPNYAFPGDVVGGFFTDEQVEHFSKFNLLLFWGMDLIKDNTKGPNWWVPNEECNTLKQAAALKAANPDILLFPYITGFMTQTWFEAQAKFNKQNYSDWWLRDSLGVVIDCNDTVHNHCFGYSQGAPGKLYDWRQERVREYFVNEVISTFVSNKNISGLFLDDTTDVAQRCMHPPSGISPCTGSWTFTEQDQLDFVNATLTHLDAAMTSMTTHGKSAIVSTTCTIDSTPLNSSTFDKLLRKYGAFHFMEFFQGNQDDIDTALALTQAGGALMIHAAGPNSVGPFSDREYSLAAFLIVMSEYSYYGMGSGWSVSSFPWYPEFDRPLGKPLGPASKSSDGIYFREFVSLNVTLNPALHTATILWHGLGPVPGPSPPPTPAPPPPYGKYAATGHQIVHQNPPSYSLIKNVQCENMTYKVCVNISAAVCDVTAGCLSFSVLAAAYRPHAIFSELSPNTTTEGQQNEYWTTYEKPTSTPGSWVAP